MALAARIIKDTSVPSGSGSAGGLVTVLVNMSETGTDADNLIVDASALAGHANGAKLDITRAWWALSDGDANDATGHVIIEFIAAGGSNADTIALNLSGSGYYDGSAGKIANNAVNTSATGGDIQLSALSTSGFVMLELRKDGTFTA
jgi:hypothetical protein